MVLANPEPGERLVQPMQQEDIPPKTGKRVDMFPLQESSGFALDLAQYAEFLKTAKSPVLQPVEIEKTEVGGTPALRFSMKAPKLPEGQQTPQTEKMMEAMFGADGKLDAWIVPAGEHSVVMGYVNKENVQSAMQAIKQGSKGLAADAEVTKTAALLPAGAAPAPARPAASKSSSLSSERSCLVS